MKEIDDIISIYPELLNEVNGNFFLQDKSFYQEDLLVSCHNFGTSHYHTCIIIPDKIIPERDFELELGFYHNYNTCSSIIRTGGILTLQKEITMDDKFIISLVEMDISIRYIKFDEFQQCDIKIPYDTTKILRRHTLNNIING